MKRLDARQLVENLLRVSESVDDTAILKEMLRIAQEGDLIERLARLLRERAVDPGRAQDLLQGLPEEIAVGVANRLSNAHKGLNVVYRDSARDAASALKNRLRK